MIMSSRSGLACFLVQGSIHKIIQVSRAEGNTIIISFNFINSNTLIFIIVDFVAQTGWMMVGPGYGPVSVGAGQSDRGASLYFLPSVLSLYHIPSELVISCFLSSF